MLPPAGCFPCGEADEKPYLFFGQEAIRLSDSEEITSLRFNQKERGPGLRVPDGVAIPPRNLFQKILVGRAVLLLDTQPAANPVGNLLCRLQPLQV